MRMGALAGYGIIRMTAVLVLFCLFPLKGVGYAWRDILKYEVHTAACSTQSRSKCSDSSDDVSNRI